MCIRDRLITDLAKRSGIDDIISFSEILVIAKKSGGNLIAIAVSYTHLDSFIRRGVLSK